jgi:hypothetical protein
MPDVSVITTIISTAGALCGALGGIALTNGISARREERQERRRLHAARTAARQQAYADLLGAVAQMRVHIETTCQRYWKDMNIRLATIEDHAVTVGLLASRSALLSGEEVADAALALGVTASNLSAWAATNVQLDNNPNDPNERYIAGEMPIQPDLSELDQLTKKFFRLAAAAASRLALETSADAID